MKIYPIFLTILIQITNYICEGSAVTNCNETCGMCCMTDGVWACCNFSELFNDAISSEHFQKLLKNGQKPGSQSTEKTPTNSLNPAAFSIGIVLGAALGTLALFICCGVAIHRVCRLPQQGYMPSFIHRRGRNIPSTIPMQSGAVINITISSHNGLPTINYHSHCEDENEQTCRLTDLPPKYEDISKTIVTNDNEFLPPYSTLDSNI